MRTKVKKLYIKIENLIEEGFSMEPGVVWTDPRNKPGSSLPVSGCIRMAAADNNSKAHGVIFMGDMALSDMGFTHEEIMAMEHGFENPHASLDHQCIYVHDLTSARYKEYVDIGENIRKTYYESAWPK